MPVLTKINTNSIADDAVTSAKYAAEDTTWIQNSSSQDISGTYSDNRLYTSDAYTLSGNATINSNLIYTYGIFCTFFIYNIIKRFYFFPSDFHTISIQ